MKTKITFIEPEDPSVDGEFRLFVDGKQTRFAAQDARGYAGYLALNEEHYVEGKLESVEFHGQVPSVKQAKAWLMKKAEELK